jgi:hypothetical protein
MCAVLLSTTNPSWEILVPAAEAAVEYGIRAQSMNCQTSNPRLGKQSNRLNLPLGSLSRSALTFRSALTSARLTFPLGSPPARPTFLPADLGSLRERMHGSWTAMVLYFARHWHPAVHALHAAWRPNLVWSVREQIIRKPRSAILKFELNAMFLSNTPRRDSEIRRPSFVI